MKYSKPQVDYRPAESPDRSCVTCLHFNPEREGCRIVKGHISPEDTCDVWKGGERELASLGVFLVVLGAWYLREKGPR